MPQTGLNKDVEGDAIWARVKSLNAFSGAMSGAEDTIGQTYWRAIADEINKHFQTYAKILPGTLTVNVSQILDSTTQPCGGDGQLDSGIGVIE